MAENVLDGGFVEPARDAAYAFRAALEAMSRPGKIVTLSGAHAAAPCSDAAATLVLTLCDPTTPVFLAPSHDTVDVREWVTFHTGAPFVGPENCAFALGTWEALLPLERFSPGTPEYPDRAATLIVERPSLDARGATLAGPGIATTAHLNLPETAAFQRNARAFPLGLDFFLTCGTRVAGLPRSTKVTEG